jgi:hypothetical protein
MEIIITTHLRGHVHWRADGRVHLVARRAPALGEAKVADLDARQAHNARLQQRVVKLQVPAGFFPVAVWQACISASATTWAVPIFTSCMSEVAWWASLASLHTLVQDYG